jgi:solute carrier family 25 protein 16
MISVFFTYPLEIIRVRMAFQTRHPSDPSLRQHPHTFSRAFMKIYHEGASTVPSTSSVASTASNLFTRFPLLKFYRGFTVTIIGMIPYAGMSFLTWDFLRSRFLPPPSSSPSRSGHRTKATPVADLCIGAVSGALAQTVAYPFEIVRRRMQVGGITRPDRWLRWGETVKTVWDAGGWRGFYVGLSIGYLKVVPMTAMSFAVWQGMKRVLGV